MNPKRHSKPTVHNFDRSLERSHRADKLAIWPEMYMQLFESYHHTESHLEYSEEQLKGVDRVVFFRERDENGNRVFTTVDEKYREKNRRLDRVFNDCLCETLYDRDKGILGWIRKQLICDYILYAILPLGVGWLMSRRHLQNAWLKHGAKWEAQYGIRLSHNEGWVSENVPVPWDELRAVMGDFMWQAHFGERHNYLEEYFQIRILPHDTPTTD